MNKAVSNIVHYHTDCGHIIEQKEASSMVTDRTEDGSSRLYLDNCPTCQRIYPEIKYLDKSVCEDAQTIVYRLKMCGFDNIYIPWGKYSVQSIRLKSVKMKNIETALDAEIVDVAEQWDDDVLISLSKNKRIP